MKIRGHIFSTPTTPTDNVALAVDLAHMRGKTAFKENKAVSEASTAVNFVLLVYIVAHSGVSRHSDEANACRGLESASNGKRHSVVYSIQYINMMMWMVEAHTHERA